MSNSRLVYSTGGGRTCVKCGWPLANCQCSKTLGAGKAAVPDRVIAKLRMEKKGRGGKTVTVVYGLPRNPEFLRQLSQELKRACGAAKPTCATNIITYMWVQDGWFSVRARSSGRRTMSHTT